MRADLSEKVAIVTGASRGIGKVIAESLADAGAAVVLAARSTESLEDVALAIEARGGRALAVPTDVTDGAAVAGLCAQAIGTLGRIDILVNNAGTSYVANVLMSKEDRWREVLLVNVMSAYFCTKAVLKHMIKAKGGRIVNIASVSGMVGAAHNSCYAASKGALIAFTKSVALEVARLGITVNAICPWHVETELAHQTMEARGKMFGKSSQEYIDDLVSNSPQRRLITAEEVAALAVYLASDQAAGITGQALNLSGGAIMT